jgi:hypothetical protein
MAAGTVGLGGALGAIFAAGEVVNEDRKLRSIQGLGFSSVVGGLEGKLLDRYAKKTATIDTAKIKSVLVNDRMMAKG